MAAVKVRFGEYKRIERALILDEVTAKAIVNFRPHNNYKGEFGFDWMRMGDTGKGGDDWYAKIVGEYEGFWDLNKEKYEGGIFEIKDWAYKNLMNEFKVMRIPWKNDFYIIPIATIYPKKSAKFTLKLEIEEEPKEIIYKFNDEYFSLNKSNISILTKGKHQLTNELEVTCVKEFDSVQNIDVIAKSSNDKEELIGRLKIKANSKANRRVANIVFVNVITNINGYGVGNEKHGILAADKITQETYLTKFLNQALVSPNIDKDGKLELFDIRKSEVQTLNNNYTLPFGRKKIFNKYNTSGGDGLITFLEKQFNAIEANSIYKDHYKVFFMGEHGARKKAAGGLQFLGGHASDIGSKECIMYTNPKNFVVTHELMHCMGLYHSFNNNSKYTFKKGKTDNIMDYSHLATPKITQISTYQWQWKALIDSNEQEI